jgi:hypothetical protein
VSLPFVSRPLSLVKEASSLGARRLKAELFTSASSTTPAAVCEANLTVNASQMVGNCSSGGGSRNECSFPQVKEFVAIKSFVKISAASCREGSSFGLTADKKKIWVDDGCRADFTFSYIPN